LLEVILEESYFILSKLLKSLISILRIKMATRNYPPRVSLTFFYARDGTMLPTFDNQTDSFVYSNRREFPNLNEITLFESGDDVVRICAENRDLLDYHKSSGTITSFTDKNDVRGFRKRTLSYSLK
jgi:hypothetical protein